MKKTKANELKLTLIVTHDCNLNCVYCYQHKTDRRKKMPLAVAKQAISDALENSPFPYVDIAFIGGEPLLEFKLIKEVCEWAWSNSWSKGFSFYATTNGTLLSKEMKEWFHANRERFRLALSLDGKRETHNANRCNSFDLIDFDFFLSNWPDVPAKMTISDKNLSSLADDMIFIHELGFKLSGCNFAEGCFVSNFEENSKIIATQYKKMVDYYLQHQEIKYPRLFNLSLDLCEIEGAGSWKKCGTGENHMSVVDYDGTKYPCIYLSPVTLKDNQLKEVLNKNLAEHRTFINEACLNNCYLYPVCDGCYGDNFTTTGDLSLRSSQKCFLAKLRVSAAANYQGRLLAKKLENSETISEEDLLTIKAINKINSQLSQF